MRFNHIVLLALKRLFIFHYKTYLPVEFALQWGNKSDTCKSIRSCDIHPAYELVVKPFLSPLSMLAVTRRENKTRTVAREEPQSDKMALLRRKAIPHKNVVDKVIDRVTAECDVCVSKSLCFSFLVKALSTGIIELFRNCLCYAFLSSPFPCFCFCCFCLYAYLLNFPCAELILSFFLIC